MEIYRKYMEICGNKSKIPYGNISKIYGNISKIYGNIWK